ncbi:MAG: DUF2158 domain-containing protein, partial [Planktomarina sp.]
DMHLEAGSVVVLKSGVPHMTIEELGEHSDAKCTWFAEYETRREWFSLSAIKLAPPNVEKRLRKVEGVA